MGGGNIQWGGTLSWGGGVNISTPWQPQRARGGGVGPHPDPASILPWQHQAHLQWTTAMPWPFRLIIADTLDAAIVHVYSCSPGHNCFFAGCPLPQHVRQQTTRTPLPHSRGGHKVATEPLLHQGLQSGDHSKGLHIPCHPQVPRQGRGKDGCITPAVSGPPSSRAWNESGGIWVVTITRFECHVWNSHEIRNMWGIAE